MRELLNLIQVKESNILASNEAAKLRLEKRRKKENDMLEKYKIIMQSFITNE